MQQEETFNRMVENAFDFLRKSLTEFDKDPKYSVINFHAAIELILKARLLCEHWTLIISRPESADRTDFLSGNFQSVGIKEAKIRLEKVANDGLTQQEYDCFMRLSDHRNKIVHFFHLGQLGNRIERERIVTEHCLAWYFLQKILIERWKKYFSVYYQKIKKLDRDMHKHREYLQAKFNALNDKIKGSKKEGYKYHKCPSCNFRSLQEDVSNKTFIKFKCLVCDFMQNGLVIDCPDCGTPIKFINEGFGSCTHCERYFDPNKLAEVLFDHLEHYLAKKDGDDSYDLGNCGYCDGFHTVVLYEGQYICTSCLEVFDSVERCEWCGELNTGDIENSYWNGCNQCDGKAGRDKD